MGKLTATMVVDLQDRTGRTAQTIIGNLNRLKRAERDYGLARDGMGLSRKDRAMERLMMETERDAEERRARIGVWRARGSTAALAAAAAGVAAYKSYADVEDRVAGIVINADKGVDAIGTTMGKVRSVAKDTRQGFDTVNEGLETLVASGRSLDEALAFLPSVALTAKASRSAISDIALTADAVGGSFNIAGTEMQKAFDEMVTGGKLGKFELKDMSQYLPRLAPAFAALGYKGTDGLAKLIAMLQVVRMQAGSSGEAATYLENVLNKMYSEDVAKRFGKFGIDLPKALNKARKEGKDVLEVFLDMTQLAMKGDLTNITRLFGDAEMQKGVRALVMLRDQQKRFNDEISRSKGSALKDFNAQAELAKNKIQDMANNWDTFVSKVGSKAATVISPVLDAINRTISDDDAIESALGDRDAEQRGWLQNDFYGRFAKANPEASYERMVKAYREALIKVGRGEMSTVFDDLAVDEGRRKGGGITSRYASRGTYDEAGRKYLEDHAEFPGGDSHLNPYKLPKTGVPSPLSRPAPLTPEEVRQRQEATLYGYPSRGTYEPGVMEAERQRQIDATERYHQMQNEARREESKSLSREERRRRLREADPATLGMDGMGGMEIQKAREASDGIDPMTTNSVQSVTLSGTPTVITQPSGVQQVQVTNPVRPNVTINMPVTINEAANTELIMRQLDQALSQAANRTQASTQTSGY